MNKIIYSLEQFRLLDNVPIAICVVDKAYNIVFWNNCIESWTKKKKADVLNKKLGTIYPHFNEKKYTCRIDPILSGGPPAIFSSQLHGHLFPSKLSNGQFRILQTTVSNVPAEGDNQYYALFAIKDFTELSYRIIDYREMQKKARQEIEQRKKVEQELRIANEEIVKQQKTAIEEERLKVLLQMAGATAHELNQPLMILLGNIELLKLDRNDPEKLTEYISKISDSGNRIANIIKKIQRVKRIVKKTYSAGADIVDIHQKEKILHVEDDHAYFENIRALLKDTKYKYIKNTDSLSNAKSLLLKKDFDLIVLDYLLPDGDAFELLDFLRLKKLNLPVIILTGQGSESIASRILRHGAGDYLSKTKLDKESLLESIEFVLEKHYLNQDKERAMVVMGDLSAKDELTGIYNRRYFTEALIREISGAQRYQKKLALCMIDLDHFKMVNDSYGHVVGDAVLKKIADIIKNAVREYDIPCRYGGEEFSLILPDTDRDGAEIVCERIRNDVADYVFKYDHISFQITLSAGVTFLKKSKDSNSKQSDMLIKQADAALYKAKNMGRNRVLFL
ncbi:diguanylate cyclase [Desulfobacula toluolica]|uniref:Two component sensor histidine kinase modulated diguanylate cyclase n=1 Tax=Desulfobacula toluolica (strain DSM 7467 / Tol2) TaxID=651182 RepID=K0NKU1_DESTT|nr:diguanylate cyclase [Desulfobacula toluolica]CCK81400.1 two component sensor histidine kinase modulated diguanylate cyclase [Desulfobacula toluolica Tol2]